MQASLVFIVCVILYYINITLRLERASLKSILLKLYSEYNIIKDGGVSGFNSPQVTRCPYMSKDGSLTSNC